MNDTGMLDAVVVDGNTITGLLIVRVNCPLVVVGETELAPSVEPTSVHGGMYETDTIIGPRAFAENLSMQMTRKEATQLRTFSITYSTGL